jgi:hypothetical protein
LIEDLNGDLKQNQFYNSILESRQEIYKDLTSNIELFKAPRHFKENTEFTLSKYLDIFDSEEID